MLSLSGKECEPCEKTINLYIMHALCACTGRLSKPANGSEA